MSYASNTPEDVGLMLRSIGVESIDDLFSDIPASVRLKEALPLEAALSEVEVCALLKNIGGANRIGTSFLGAGAYNHYVPAAVDALSSRSEFYTAYTPYQAEVSQGTLAAVFEFQTMICRLTGMDVANASMYDGATSLAEAVFMSARGNNRRRVLVGGPLHPSYRRVLDTYCWANDLEVIEADSSEGTADVSRLEGMINEQTSALVVQSPNFFGCIEDLKSLADLAHSRGATLIAVVTEPLSLGLLKSPGSLGADIVCGEARSFGNPLGFGGPALGMLSAKAEFTRKMPGRLIGRTVDSAGHEAFVLTLQTREQHIRREQATSNICSNQGLCALRAVIYLSLLGKGIGELASLNHRIASYCRNRLLEKGYEPVFNKPYFNEFAIRIPGADALLDRLAGEGISAGVDLGSHFSRYKDCVLMCCTEMTSPDDVDRLIETMQKV